MMVSKATDEPHEIEFQEGGPLLVQFEANAVGGPDKGDDDQYTHDRIKHH